MRTLGKGSQFRVATAAIAALGLKGQDLKALGREADRGLARTRSDLEGTKVRGIDPREADHIVDDLLRVATSRSVVQLRHLAEHEPLLPHCSRVPDPRPRRTVRAEGA